MTDLHQWQCAATRVIDAIVTLNGLDTVSRADLAALRSVLVRTPVLITNGRAALEIEKTEPQKFAPPVVREPAPKKKQTGRKAARR